jgi:hypothetical protein
MFLLNFFLRLFFHLVLQKANLLYLFLFFFEIYQSIVFFWFYFFENLPKKNALI